MAGWSSNQPYYNQPQYNQPLYNQGQCSPSTVDQVSQSLGTANISDPVEYATQGRGMLTFPVNGPEIDGETFKDFWIAAHKNKAVDGVRLPPGEYHLKPPKDRDSHHMQLNCKSDGDDRTSPFLLDLSNTFLWLTNKDNGGISVMEGENIELRGPFTICNNLDSWTFGQGTLVSYNEQELEWIVQGHDGYPNDRVFLQGGSLAGAVVWDPVTRLMKDPDVHDLRTHKAEKIGDNRYKLKLDYAQDYGINPGDYITARWAGCSAVTLDSCKHTTVVAMTIHTSSMFGVYDCFGSGTVYRDCFILPYPRPIGNDGQLPLLSTCADGIHNADAGEGPKVINCYFGGLGDDAIAIRGHFAPVASACREEKYVLTLEESCYLRAGQGEPIQLYGTEGEDLGTAKIASIQRIDNPLAKGTKISQFCFDDASTWSCTKVVVEEWPESWGDKVGLGCAAAYPSRCGAGFQALGCRVYNTRGRGILAKASRALVADNTFTHLKGCGIAMTPEYVCREAGFVTDVTIRNNVIDSLAPGIWVGGSTNAQGDMIPTPHKHNRNIIIENNSISHSQKTPFIVTSSSDVVVRNNTIKNCLPYRPDVDKDMRSCSWEVNGKQMFFKYASNLTLSNNRIFKDEPGDFSGDYLNPMEFCECINVVHEAETCSSYPAYGSYPTDTA
ncbi:g11291 [Coccomyxa elongata]